MRRKSILTGGCLLGFSLMLGHLLVRPTSGQGDAASSPQTGRYQVVSDHGVIVIDTATGRVWSWEDDERWESLGSPAEPKKQ
jgi:hypothetical protein